MFGRKKPSPLDGVNLLDLAPAPVAEIEERDGKVVLLRPKPRTRGLRGLSDRITTFLSAPKVRLDEFGSFTWRRLDGRTTVAEVAAALREEFGETAEPVEDRLGLYIRLLRREGMLIFPGYDDVRG
jgi:hypothetical protein